jgi:hypothetical protein
MKILRTPDERFADLPGYPFVPRYAGEERGRVVVDFVRASPPAAQ